MARTPEGAAPPPRAGLVAWRGWVAVAAVLAVALSAPSLADGLQGEDWGIVHDATTRAFDPWPLRRAPEVARANGAAREAGLVPWFASPDLQIVFFRPLGTWLLQLDALVARTLGLGTPAAIQLVRAHSLAWLAALVVAGGLVLRRLVGISPAALVALVTFATDDGKAMAAGWISNRPALASAALGLLALVAHDRWRREARLGSAIVAPLALGAAYLAGETALGAALLVLSHALSTERGWAAKARAAAPAALVTLAWATFYALSGYGATGSSVYLSPLGSPRTFVLELPLRLAASALGLLVWPAADGWYAAAHLIPPALALGLGALLACGAVLLVARSTASVPGARLWLLGGALATCATCTVAPSERVLLVPSLAAAALLGLVASAWLEQARDRGRSRAARVAAGAGVAWILGVHVALTATLSPLRARAFVPYEEALRGAVDSAFAGVRPEQQLFLVRVPDAGFSGLTVQLGGRLRRAPPRVRVLYPGTGAATVTRLDSHTLRLRVDGGFFDSLANRMVHDVSRPLAPGHEVRLAGATVVVEESGADGLPRAVLLRTERPLDDAGHVFRMWTGARFEPFPLPSVGSSVEVEPLAKLPFGSARHLFGLP